MTRLRAFSYYGGKNSKLTWLLPLLQVPRRTDTFVDACCGSAAVALNWSLGRSGRNHLVINDLNKDIFNFFATLRDRKEEFVEQIRFTPYSREEYDRAFEPCDDDDDMERARKFFVRVTQGFGSRVGIGEKTGFSSSVTRRSSSMTRELIDSLLRIADILRVATLENRDACEVIKKFGRFDSTLIYVDPPYPHESRVTKSGYSNEPDDDWHIELLDTILASEASFAISSYHNEIYDDKLKSWNVHELKSTAHYRNEASDSSQCDRVEVLYTNYVPTTKTRSLL